MVFSGIHFHDSVLNLKYNKSYNIQSGFGTCREWSKYKEDLFNIFSFKTEDCLIVTYYISAIHTMQYL